MFLKDPISQLFERNLNIVPRNGHFVFRFRCSTAFRDSQPPADARTPTFFLSASALSLL